MTTLNPIQDNSYGIVGSLMERGRFSGWNGWFWDHHNGRWVKFWSKRKFPIGYVIWATKTINDWVHLCDERRSMWMNGDDPDDDIEPSDWMQGSLL